MNTNECIRYIIDNLIGNDKIDLEPGRHMLSGESYYNVETYTTKDPAICCYEAHKKYIDIQYMVEGEEFIYVSDIDDLQVSGPYSAEKDVMFFTGGENVDPELMTPGKYLVFHPQDGHKPSVRVGETSSAVKKVVFKVKIDE